jgi:hypothetical protein
MTKTPKPIETWGDDRVLREIRSARRQAYAAGRQVIRAEKMSIAADQRLWDLLDECERRDLNPYKKGI